MFIDPSFYFVSGINDEDEILGIVLAYYIVIDFYF